MGSTAFLENELKSVLYTAKQEAFGSIIPDNNVMLSYTPTMMVLIPGVVSGYNLRPFSRKTRPIGHAVGEPPGTGINGFTASPV